MTEALRFVPDTLTITRGTRVRWVNESDFFHTVTPRNTSQPGVWSRRETSGRGPVLEHTFSVGGQTYNYFCEPHESFGMVARIRVE
ncbi:MAG: copper-binding protein [Gemmatimonadetes bacterium]|nr:copper-binding protein [Gemmatimonadota bacterium]